MTYTAEMHTVGDVPMLTLTGPRGRLDLSQGQCASIVAMAEMHRNAQPAQPTASDAAEAAVIVGAMDDAYRQECSIAQDEMAQHTRALHAILTAIRSGAIPLPDDVPQIAALRAKLAEEQAKGITQHELARVLGLSPTVISHYENGRREPTLLILTALARYFQVSTDFLLGVDADHPLLVNTSQTET